MKFPAYIKNLKYIDDLLETEQNKKIGNQDIQYNVTYENEVFRYLFSDGDEVLVTPLFLIVEKSFCYFYVDKPNFTGDKSSMDSKIYAISQDVNAVTGLPYGRNVLENEDGGIRAIEFRQILSCSNDVGIARETPHEQMLMEKREIALDAYIRENKLDPKKPLRPGQIMEAVSELVVTDFEKDFSASDK